jgi:flagellar M-ring protein FliF
MPALLQQMSPKGRIVLGASAVGILVVAFLMFRVATAPSYSTMMTGLDPAKVGQITAALDEKGIAYELQNNGTALAVEKAQTGAARVALAEGGVSGGGAGSEQPGYELLKDQKLGASDFQQRITYQRALEGELARTVDQIEGVNGAEVQLTLPEDELFADEKKPATAAVLLGGAASPLDAGSVRGVANLVSSSVENLKTENVTITDSTGRMLWPQNEPGSAGAATASKTVAEAKYANELESSLNALLMRTVGRTRRRSRSRPTSTSTRSRRSSCASRAAARRPRRSSRPRSSRARARAPRAPARGPTSRPTRPPAARAGPRTTTRSRGRRSSTSTAR